MLKHGILLAVCVAGACAGSARAQFGPPGGGGGDISLTPPTPTTMPMTMPGVGATVAPRPRENALSGFHANETYTANALMGFVNDQPVFANDIFRPIDASLRRLAANTSEYEFRQAARPIITSQLSTLASDITFVSAAQATLTEQDWAKINVVLSLETSRLYSDYGGSKAAAEASLQKIGSSIARELADRKRGYIKQLYIQKNLVPRIQVTRQMALDAYEKDPKRWEQTAQIELYTITMFVSRGLREPGTPGKPGEIKANPTAAEIAAAEVEAMAKGREIIAKLKAGQEFARLVEDYTSSDSARDKGGRWGLINQGSMVNTKLADFVFALPAGGIGGPLLMRENDFKASTVVVAMLGKKTEAKVKPFEEAQAELALELRKQQERDLEVKEMEKLSKNAAIEALDRREMLDVALDAAVTRYATK